MLEASKELPNLIGEHDHAVTAPMRRQAVVKVLIALLLDGLRHVWLKTEDGANIKILRENSQQQ